MGDWRDIPKVRDLTFTTRSCLWEEHDWDRFEVTLYGEHQVIAVLCQNCGRDIVEAMAALPIVVVPAEYPELKKARV